MLFFFYITLKETILQRNFDQASAVDSLCRWLDYRIFIFKGIRSNAKNVKYVTGSILCYKSLEFHLSLMRISFFFFNFYTCRTRLSPLECCRLFCENISIPPWRQALSSAMEATAITCRILLDYLVAALWRVGPTSLGLDPADFLSDSNPLNHGSLQLHFRRYRLIYNFIKYMFILMT